MLHLILVLVRNCSFKYALQEAGWDVSVNLAHFGNVPLVTPTPPQKRSIF